MKANHLAWTALFVITIFSLTGCAAPNYFSKFYQDNLPAYEGHTESLLPYSGKTKIINATNPDDFKRLIRSGYSLIGESHFEVSGAIGEGMILAQGKSVGADIVLYGNSYLGSYKGSQPLMQYNPGTTSTTYSSGTVNVNAFGSGGYAYGNGVYSGNSTTTTPGTFSTQMIPVTISRYQHDAVFLRKSRPPILGTSVRSITQEMRQKLEKNTGVLVVAVDDDSPAFRANFLEGDIILKFAGQEITSTSDYLQQLQLNKGQKVEIEIWRNGKTKTITVQLYSP